MRKLRRFDLVIGFIIVAVAAIVLTTAASPATAAYLALFHTPLFFFALVMLTEPLTMPPSRWLRLGYAALVGALFAPAVHIGSFYSSPEIALLAGNLFSFLVSPKGRATLTFVEKRELARGIYEFVFKPDRPVAFKAGQYLEWSLPGVPADSRGQSSLLHCRLGARRY